MIYKNGYALIKKLNVILGILKKVFICRRCLSSYTIENNLRNHKEDCGDYDICTLRISSEPHLHWKDHFHKNPLFFRMYADFEAYNEINNSSKVNKTTNFYKQNPVCNGYRIVSDLEEVLKNGYSSSNLEYVNID